MVAFTFRLAAFTFRLAALLHLGSKLRVTMSSSQTVNKSEESAIVSKAGEMESLLPLKACWQPAMDHAFYILFTLW